MSFLDHLEELRWRLIKSFLAILIMTLISAILSDIIINYFILAPAKNDFFMYRILKIEAIDLPLQSRILPGQFFAFWGTMFFFGFITSTPVLFYQLWAFIAPALRISSRWQIIRQALVITFCFLLGSTFGYIILAPFALQFFSNFHLAVEVKNDFDITEYLSSLLMWIFACGCIFQIPIISYYLTKAGLLNPQILRRFRKIAIVVCFILGALLSPPDPISQILLAFPLILLYELGIYISSHLHKKNKKSF